MNRREDPLNEVGPRRVLNSEWSLLIILFTRIDDLLLTTQNEGIIITSIIIALNQLSGNPRVEDEGSKTENRFVIIIFILKSLF